MLSFAKSASSLAKKAINGPSNLPIRASIFPAVAVTITIFHFLSNFRHKKRASLKAPSVQVI